MIMSILLKEIKNFFLFFFLNAPYDRVFFIEKKNYLKDFEKFLFNQNPKKNFIILSFENLNLKDINKKTITIESNFLRNLIFKTLNAKFLYASTPDLNNSVFVKSIYKTKYLYIQHSPVGLLNAYKENSFTNFDLIFCNSIYQKKDVLTINKKFKKKIKSWRQKIILKKVNLAQKSKNKTILIAPTWSTNFYRDEILDKLDNLNFDYEVTFRPHYMSILLNEISKQYFINSNFKEDFNSEFNITKYDLLISDWSGIYLEYLINTHKRPLLINTKEKKRNQIFHDEISIEKKLRNELAFQIEINELDKILTVVDQSINKNNKNNIEISKLKKIFYL